MIKIRVPIKSFAVCPLCDKPIQENQLCLAIYDNDQKLAGYAHEDCLKILNRAISLGRDLL